jgi:hypothetical protein
LSRAVRISDHKNNHAIKKSTPPQQKQQDQQQFAIVILCHCGLNGLGSILEKATHLLSFSASRPALGAHAAPCPQVAGGFFPGHEADHSLSCSS